jgi:L-amino acid N-acyltransferase YncA
VKNDIRLAIGKDASKILEIYGPFCIQSPITFEVVPPSREEMAERISSTTKRYPWLVCECDGLIRGYVYASRHSERAAYGWSVNVAAYMHPSSRGRGLGRVLYSVLFDILRQQGFFKAYAGITLPNPASVALHEHAGFRMVGVYHGVGFKAGAWHDVSWWELSLRPETDNPAEPKTIAAVVNTKQWAEAIYLGEECLNGGTPR